MTAVPSASDAFNGTQPIATSFYGVGGDASLVQHIHLKWDATLVATITFESNEFPEVSITDPSTGATAGNWIQENPTTAYIAVSPAGAGTIVNATITVPGGTAGGASINIGNWGGARLRVKVVATVAGVLRIRSHGKF